MGTRAAGPHQDLAGRRSYFCVVDPARLALSPTLAQQVPPKGTLKTHRSWRSSGTEASPAPTMADAMGRKEEQKTMG